MDKVALFEVHAFVKIFLVRKEDYLSVCLYMEAVLYLVFITPQP